jgi:hypothetical protein
MGVCGVKVESRWIMTGRTPALRGPGAACASSADTLSCSANLRDTPRNTAEIGVFGYPIFESG